MPIELRLTDRTNMNEPNALVSEETAKSRLSHLLPGSVLTAITALSGSFSNATCAVTGQGVDSSSIEIIVRRYGSLAIMIVAKKPGVGIVLFQFLQRSSVPVPELLFLDDTGDVLCSPSIVTRYVRGALDMPPSNPLTWVANIAKILAKIHRIPCDKSDRGLLLGARTETLWFLQSVSYHRLFVRVFTIEARSR